MLAGGRVEPSVMNRFDQKPTENSRCAMDAPAEKGEDGAVHPHRQLAAHTKVQRAEVYAKMSYGFFC